MIIETQVDFPAERPKMAIFRIERHLSKRDAINILSKIIRLQRRDYRHFVLDLRKSQGVSSAGLGMIGYLAKEREAPLPLLTRDEGFKKLFQVAKLERDLLVGHSEEELFYKLDRMKL